MLLMKGSEIMEQQLTLVEGPVSSTLLKFAGPFLLASLLQALYGGADLFIVGQFSDTAGVCAVSTGSQIMQTITEIILGLTTGGTVLIGQYLGAKKDEDAAQAIGEMISLFAIVSIIMAFVMTVFSKEITFWMNTPESAVECTAQYIFICSAGIPFIAGYNALSGILRGMGNSKVPLYFVTAACIINIAADLFLVGVLKMGAAGAGIATIAAQGVSLFLGISYIKRSSFSSRFKKKYLNFKAHKAGQVLKLGLPIALQDGLIDISFLLITVIINGMGVVASASVGVVEKIIIFAMLIPCSFESAISVMAAQNFGAGKTERAKEALHVGMTFSFAIGCLFFLYCQIHGENITSIFTSDRQVIESSALYLKSYSIDCIMVSFTFCMNSFFSGCGHSIFPMIHSLISTFAVRIPVSYCVSRLSGITLYEMGLAAPLATFVSIILCTIYMMSGRWKYKVEI